GGGAESEERELLEPRARGAPASGGAQAPERVDVEDEEGDGEGDDDGLGEERGGEAREGEGVPARLEARGGGLGRSGGGLDVAEEGQDVEEPGEHVAPRGGGRDGLDAQGMDGEEEGGHGGAPAEGDGGGGGRQGGVEEVEGEEVEGQRGGGVEEEAREVIAGGIHAPEEIVEAEGEPGQGDVVAGVEGGEHPAELGPAQAAIVGIVEEVERIVPRRESIAECRQKC